MSIGLVLVILASICFGILPSLGKALILAGFTPSFMVFIYVVICLMIYSVISAGYEKSIRTKLPLRQLFSLILTGAVGIGGTSFFLNSSYRYIPIGTATLIHFTYPVVVTILMAVIFREKFTKYKSLAAVLSIIGMLCVTGFSFSGKLEGMALAFISGIAYATYIIANDKSSFSSLPTYLKMTYLSLGSVIVFGIQVLLTGLPKAAYSMKALIFFLMIGLLEALGFSLLTIGINKIGASKAAYAAMLEPVTCVLLGIIVYHDPFQLTMAIGIIAILACLFLVNKS